MKTAIETAKEIDGDYFKAPLHIKALNDVILNAVRGNIKRIIVNMPPRHGKSEFISRYVPFWYLCNFPDNRIILVCYTSALAKTFGRSVMQMVKQSGSDYGIELSPDCHGSDRFDLKDRRGGMDSIGAMGSITGKGANLLIIDDPIKNNAQANSLVQRENLWDWFVATVLTRIEPNGVLILVMTRWHEDDLCGRIINSQHCTYFSINKMDYTKQIDWLIVKIPAFAEKNDPLNRNIGEALWKERYDADTLNDIKANVGSRWFSALYQQNPSPSDSVIFKRRYFRYFKEDDEYFYMLKPYDEEKQKIQIKIEFQIFAVADLAISTKQTADYTAIIVFAKNRSNDILILDVIRERFEGAKHLSLIEEISEKWNPVIIGIESVQYQKTLVQSCMNKGLRVSELKPRDDKQSRALPMQAKLEAGKVYFKQHAPWLEAFENELQQFPNAKHDDQVDAFSYIAFMLHNSAFNLPSSRKRRKSLTSDFGLNPTSSKQLGLF